MRVAVIDNDSGFLQVLTKRLGAHGWRHRVHGGPIPVDVLIAMRLDALIIDPEVLGPRAWDELEHVCEALPSLAIVCTGRSTVAQRVRALRMGADDWLNKPCHPEELIARVEAVCRRRRRGMDREGAESIAAGDLQIRPEHFQAYVDGISVELTRREYELLELLAGAEGRVLEREHVYEQVWGYAMARGDRSVDVFVRKLRQKLARVSPGWKYIHTHFGIGYRFAAERVDGAVAVIPEPAGAEPTVAAADPAPADERPAADALAARARRELVRLR